MRNKKIIFFLVIISIISLTISACQSEKEDLVAKVNGEVITRKDFEKELNIVKESKKMEYGEDIFSGSPEGDEILKELEKNVLNKLIIEKLILKEIGDMNISISDEEIENEIQNYKEELGGEEQYQAFMEKNNFSKEFLQEYFKKQLIFEKHREIILEETIISEEESRKYFEENKDQLMEIRASHILVRTEEEGKKILKRIENGEDFGELAKEESLDSATAFKGGDLGYFTKEGDLALSDEFKILSDTAFTLNEGETSDLLETVLGYHIIFAQDKKDNYEALKGKIELILKKEKHDEEISRLWSEAKIKIYED